MGCGGAKDANANDPEKKEEGKSPEDKKEVNEDEKESGEKSEDDKKEEKKDEEKKEESKDKEVDHNERAEKTEEKKSEEKAIEISPAVADPPINVNAEVAVEEKATKKRPQEDDIDLEMKGEDINPVAIPIEVKEERSPEFPEASNEVPPIVIVEQKKEEIKVKLEFRVS